MDLLNISYPCHEWAIARCYTPRLPSALLYLSHTHDTTPPHYLKSFLLN